MGVPLLLSWLRQYCSGCFTPATRELGYSCDNLYVDLNSILYSAVKAAMDAQQEYLDAFRQRDAAKASQAPSADRFEVLVLQQLVRLLDEIIFVLARPRRLVYLAADGVSPKGKMARQRERRISNSKRFANLAAKEVLGWDVNGVTSGTPFMLRAAQVIEWYAASRVQQAASGGGCGGGPPLSIIVSDGTCPGEGEYKIFEFIRSCRDSPGYDPNTTHCICSTDTDVVVCSLPLHEPHLDVLRMADNIDPAMFFSIERFRALLYRRMLHPSDLAVFERGLHDIVFILLLFGNDFLPSLFTVDIGGGQLDRLVDFLVTDFITRHRNLTDPARNRLDSERIIYFLRNVEACTVAVEGFANRVGDKRKRAPGGGLAIDNGSGGDAMEWGFGEGPDAAARREKQVKRGEDFAIGLQWALQYYCGHCASWDWFYPHNSAPTPDDLCEALRAMGDRQHFAPDPAVAAMEEDPTALIEAKPADAVPVFEQLLLLLPETSVSLLPACFQRAYDELRPLLAPDFINISFVDVHERCAALEPMMSAAERGRAGTRNGAPYGAFLGSFLQGAVDGHAEVTVSTAASQAEAPTLTPVAAAAADVADDFDAWGGGGGSWDGSVAAGSLVDLCALDVAPGDVCGALLQSSSSQEVVAGCPPTGPACPLETASYRLKIVGLPPRLLHGGFTMCGDALSRAMFATDLAPRPAVHVVEFRALFTPRALLYTPVNLLPGCVTSVMMEVTGGAGGVVAAPAAAPAAAAPAAEDLQERLRRKKEELLRKQVRDIMKE